MKDTEFGYNAAKEFNELGGSEFHMSEDAPKALKVPEISVDAAKKEKERKLFIRRAAVRVAAAMLTVVLAADSFGMDILGIKENVQPVPSEPAQSIDVGQAEPEPSVVPAVTEPVSDEPDEPEEPAASDGPVIYELAPEYMNFLANLYQACKTEDESNVGILLQEVPEGFPEMTVYYDGERAMDRMVEGTPTMKYSWKTYEDKESSIPYEASDSRVGFYFKGKVEEGSRVVLGHFIDQTDYWLEEPSYHSYEGFASFHSIEGIKSQDTFKATGFATTIEYEKVNSYNDSTVIVSSSGTYVLDNGEGYLEDGDMMIMWSWPMNDDRGSVSVSVADGRILDTDKFEIKETSVRYIRVKGSQLDRWTDSETDPFYHSIYQEIYYLTDIFDELYAEWKAER